MKKNLLLILFLIFSFSAFSQEFIMGKVQSELGDKLPNVVVLNVRTEEKSLTDKDGNFIIAAKKFDELRFVKMGFDRTSIKISADNFSQPLNISLQKTPYEIQEVEIAFLPTGNLKKDVTHLNPPKKVVALNTNMRNYVLTPSTEVAPKLTVPSAFAPPNYSAGNINFIGILKVVIKGIQKAKNPPMTTANFAETQEFYRRIKSTLDLSFYTSRGWNEEDIDRFLVYADAFSSLAKKYRKNFDAVQISSELRLAYKEYIKTNRTGSL